MAQLPQIPRKLAVLERWSWSLYGTTSSDTQEVGCIREVACLYRSTYASSLQAPEHSGLTLRANPTKLQDNIIAYCCTIVKARVYIKIGRLSN